MTREEIKTLQHLSAFLHAHSERLNMLTMMSKDESKQHVDTLNNIIKLEHKKLSINQNRQKVIFGESN